jgi:hypothetical protein
MNCLVGSVGNFTFMFVEVLRPTNDAQDTEDCGVWPYFLGENKKDFSNDRLFSDKENHRSGNVYTPKWPACTTIKMCLMNENRHLSFILDVIFFSEPRSYLLMFHHMVRIATTLP